MEGRKRGVMLWKPGGQLKERTQESQMLQHGQERLHVHWVWKLVVLASKVFTECGEKQFRGQRTDRVVST